MNDNNVAIAISQKDYLVTLFDLIASNKWSVTSVVVGLILLGLAGKFASRVIQQKPEEVSHWEGRALFLSLIFGIIFCFAGPVYTAVEIKNELNQIHQITKLDTKQAMENLRTNAKVPWAIRLIAYDPSTESHLEISRLVKFGKLGRSSDRFIFVADYKELQGYTVYEAVQKLGGAINDNHHVSAIIFPVGSQSYPKNADGASPIQLYPANARGLLHIIERIEKENENLPPGRDFISFKEVLNTELSDGEQEEIQKKTALSDWSWDKYGKSYPKYCKIVQQFRCDARYSAKTLIGEIQKDWHPLGFSRMHADDPCEKDKENEFCNINDWKNTKGLKKNFGVRVFLTRNFLISELRNHILIHFNDPKNQIIPYIGSP